MPAPSIPLDAGHLSTVNETLPSICEAQLLVQASSMHAAREAHCSQTPLTAVTCCFILFGARQVAIPLLSASPVTTTTNRQPSPPLQETHLRKRQFSAPAGALLHTHARVSGPLQSPLLKRRHQNSLFKKREAKMMLGVLPPTSSNSTSQCLRRVRRI